MSTECLNSRIRSQVIAIYKSFVSEVDPRDVLDLLIQKRVISIERKTEVMSMTTKQDRCRALLDQLMFCSHHEAFVVLKEALEEQYPWIAERLDEFKNEEWQEEASCAGNSRNVIDMVKRLELLEQRTAEQHTKMSVKKNQMKKELETMKNALELSRSNELELMHTCEAASCRIAELEGQLEDFRTKNAQLESQLYFLQESFDEAMERERILKETLSQLKQSSKFSDSEPADLDESDATRGRPTATTGDSQQAPPLPPRRSRSITMLNDNETDQLSSCYSLKDLEIKYSDLHLQNILYSYQQTEVWRGNWKDAPDVHVKMLLSGKRTQLEFFREAQILHRLNHPHVVRLIGISSLAKPFYIITEFLPTGSLRDFVKRERTPIVTLPLLIDIARQITQGMSYVVQQSIVHRDLRGGSILLDSNNMVKISNFELAMDLKDKNYAEQHSEDCAIPVRWSAPEALESWIWGSSSDVWSFGVLLYEMFSCGGLPYSGKLNREILSLIQSNYRLPCPRVSSFNAPCPDKVHQTMLWCWETEPKARPSFPKLENFFKDYFKESETSSPSMCLSGNGDDLTLLARPFLLSAIKGNTAVRGMAVLDDLLYVVRFGSTVVEIYDGKDDFRRTRRSILITSPGHKARGGIFSRMASVAKKSHVSSGIQDIACCRSTKRLYLSDWQNTCVHCVDPSKREIIFSWGVEAGEPWGISVTPESNVVVSCGDRAQLCEYSNQGVPLRTVDLQMVDEGPWHGLLIGPDSWVICHGGRYVDGYVCVSAADGGYVDQHEDLAMKGPSHLALFSNNRVLVAESERNRVVLTGPFLDGPIREILTPDHGIIMPVRLHFDDASGRLAVGLVDGSVLIYQIANTQSPIASSHRSLLS